MSLFDRARDGDTIAIDAICRRYGPRVAAYVRRNMGEVARRWSDPDDIADAVLYEAVRGLASCAESLDEDVFVARLYQTARSRIRDAVRKHRRDVGESVYTTSGPLEDETPSVGTVTRSDTHRWLTELVTRLPQKYAETVRLIGLEGLTYAEAGARLQLEPETVRKRYARARDALRSRLEDRDD